MSTIAEQLENAARAVWRDTYHTDECFDELKDKIVTRAVEVWNASPQPDMSPERFSEAKAAVNVAVFGLAREGKIAQLKAEARAKFLHAGGDDSGFNESWPSIHKQMLVEAAKSNTAQTEHEQAVKLSADTWR